MTEELIEKLNALSADEQESVSQFIDYLKGRKVASVSPFLSAAEQFIAEHPELLHRLSQ